MIKGIGIDLAEIRRFAHWHTYHEKLLKVFSQEEIDYCLQDQTLAAARFATRFAAKEAFYKAISPHLPQAMSFQSACKYCQVTTSPTGPRLNVAWKALGLSLETPPQAHLSLTHTATTAGAVVILEA